MVGLQGTAGSLVDSVQVLCGTAVVPVAEGSGEGSGDTAPDRRRRNRRTADEWRALRRAGGNSGNTYERVCPRGWAAVGLTGRHGQFVDGIVLHCAEVSP